MNTAAAEISALISLMVRAMVRDRDAVTVTTIPGPGSTTTLKVRVSDGEIGKLIGKQGRIARSLRIVLGSMCREHGVEFALDLDSSVS